MFSAYEDSPGLRKIIEELQLFDKEIIKNCEKEIDKHIIKEAETIHCGGILNKVLNLNGLPKVEFLGRLNRTSIYKKKLKEDNFIDQLIAKKIDNLKQNNLFTDTCENIRQILFHCTEEQKKLCFKWMNDHSEFLVECLTELTFSTHSTVQIEESCYTLAIVINQFNTIFVKHFKIINNFLMMIINEGTLILQNYVDERNDKLKDSSSMSFDQDNEHAFHFPLFYFHHNRCLNRQMSVAYFTLAFCLDCVVTPDIILSLLKATINTKEVSRYYMVWLIRVVILSIDKEKCKKDSDWVDLPWRIHNELIKLYIDRNSKIRNMAAEISSHIKQCSAVKLPFITKPVLDTVDIMTKVIEQKKLDKNFEIDKKDNEVNIWKRWLDLDKKINKLSDESDSGESTSSKSKTLLSADEEQKVLPKSLTLDLYSDSANELLPQHTRRTILLPNLNSLMTLTKLRTRKNKKRHKKKSKLMLIDEI